MLTLAFIGSAVAAQARNTWSARVADDQCAGELRALPGTKYYGAIGASPRKAPENKCTTVHLNQQAFGEQMDSQDSVSGIRLGRVYVVAVGKEQPACLPGAGLRRAGVAINSRTEYRGEPSFGRFDLGHVNCPHHFVQFRRNARGFTQLFERGHSNGKPYRGHEDCDQQLKICEAF